MTVPDSQPTAPPQSGPRAQPGGRRILTGWEQSRLSWARLVEFYDEIPEVYRAWLAPLIRGGGSLPYIVLTPTYEGYFRRENEKLVCLLDGSLHIVERTRDRLIPVSYRLEDISTVEVGAILLRGWITVRGLASSGLPTSSTLRFNTVTDRLFAPFVSAFRLGSRPPSGAGIDAERAKFDALMARDYKFMNYSRDSIMPGEEVLCYVLQPEIREPLISLFGRSLSRCISPTHIVILTDRELIVISEESGSVWQSFGAVKYGGIWQYVPLDRISSASLTTREDGRLNLSVHLPRRERLDLLFSPGARAEMKSLVEGLDGLPR
jgi:hypothetical protein